MMRSMEQGRLLCEQLKINNFYNRVIFVARKYGGQKIGVDRFNCYLDAMNSALVADGQVIRHSDPRLLRKPRRTGVQPPAETATSQPTLPSSQQRNTYPKSTAGRGYHRANRGNPAGSTRGTHSSMQQSRSYQSFKTQGELVPDTRFTFSRPWSSKYEFEYSNQDQID